jgi:hypothetical protein
VYVHAYDLALNAHILFSSLAKPASATPNAGAAHHPVAHTQISHTLAQGNHLASRFNSQNVR